jgi:hypothetical protein
MTKNILYLFVIVIFFIGCNSNEQSIENKIVKTPNTDINPYEFKVYIRGSGFEFDVKINAIDVNTIKNAYTYTEEAYELPKHMDGRQLIIRYSIKNPYDKTYIIPIDQYFRIDPLKGKPPNNFISRNEESGDLYLMKYQGNKLIRDKSNPVYQKIRFDANEIKEFELNLPLMPAIQTTAKVWGFTIDNSWAFDMEVGLIVDLINKKITGTEFRKDL